MEPGISSTVVNLRNGPPASRAASLGLSNELHYPANRLRVTPEGFGYWLRMLRNRCWWIVAPVVLGCCAGVIWSMGQPEMYTARATIQIRGLNENYLSMKDLDPNAAAGEYQVNDSYIQTQIGILQSSALLNRVIADLKLLDQPALFHPSTKLSGVSELLGRRTSIEQITLQDARRTILRNLKISPIGQSRMVEISFRGPDPNVTYKLVNILAERYLDFSFESRLQETEKTRQHLMAQLSELRKRLEDSGQSLQQFAEDNKLLITGEKTNVAEDRLRQLQEELSRAQADRVTKQARLDATAEAQPDSVPEVLDHGPMREYQLKLAELRRQLAETSSLFAPTSYKVKRIQEQITEIERTAEQERTNVVKRIRNEYAAAARREALITRAYAEQSGKVTDESGKLIRYGMIRSEVETNRLVYDSMLQKAREASIAAAMRPLNAQVVDFAEKPSSASSSTVSNAILGSFSGLLIGFVLVFARHRSDASLREPGEAAVHLNVRELGAIPVIKQTGSTRILSRFQSLNGFTSQALLDSDRDPAQIIVAESCRAAVASILNASGLKRRVLVVTSACPGEGKTTTVRHIGMTLAAIGHRVLIIDGDLRRPQHHTLLKAELSPGLTDLLSGSEPVTAAAIEGIVKRTSHENLFLIPSGSMKRNAADLLYRSSAERIVEIARGAYDVVLIDTPPMLHIADARLFAKGADGVILVVRAGQTTIGLAEAALQRFAEDSIRVVGIILNHCDLHTVTYGYGLRHLYR